MTPEKALGRLINLREQLTDDKMVVEHTSIHSLVIEKEHYSAIIDDLDDIIRSIERDVKQTEPCSLEEPCGVCDSEDTERRCRVEKAEAVIRRRKQKTAMRRGF